MLSNRLELKVPGPPQSEQAAQNLTLTERRALGGREARGGEEKKG